MDRGRRRLITALLAAALPVPPARAGTGAEGPLYLSARAGPGNHFAASLISAAGRVLADIPLAARGHGGAAAPDGSQAVLFGRRPGTTALVLDIARGRALSRLHPAAGRRFAGHGAYSKDGRLLFVVEVEAASGAGLVAVLDVAAGYRRIGAFPTGGVGPHQAMVLPGGRWLAVCNGGIRTHPDFPRAKLNIPTMRSSLVLLDAVTGRIGETARLAAWDHRLGLRHLDAAADGRIAVGMQYEGPASDRVPLAALWRPGQGLAPLDMPPEARVALRHYVGSIAFDASGRWIGATSPRGGAVVIWNAADGAYRGRLQLDDVCGIAARGAAGRFTVTSGRGRVGEVDARAMILGGLRAPLPGNHWDNHLIAVRGA